MYAPLTFKTQAKMAGKNCDVFDVYLNGVNEKPKRYHQISIHNKEPQMPIMNPNKTLKIINTISFNIFDKMLVPWIQ